MIILESGEANLVAREDECIGNDDVLGPCRGEDDDLGNVVGGKGFASTESMIL